MERKERKINTNNVLKKKKKKETDTKQKQKLNIR